MQYNSMIIPVAMLIDFGSGLRAPNCSVSADSG
jgi:hypothetical protein